MFNAWIPPIMADIDMPRHVKIVAAQSFDDLLQEIGRRSMMGYSGRTMFGTAFIQGNRLQFTTAIPIATLVAISEMSRSKKGDNVAAVDVMANRPREPKHGKELRQYLLNTACSGNKFILPAFTFNYGVQLSDDDPDATLILLKSDDDGMNTWPAVLQLPPGAKLDTTDGAHRRGELGDMLSDKGGVEAERKDALLKNAVDVKIVFESSHSDSHQDFADCAKAKPLPSSMVSAYDVRDERNSITKALVRGVPFLLHYVDATAANVNLSARSKNIWSLSAVRLFVNIVLETKVGIITASQKWNDAIAFFTAVVEALPQLHALDIARQEAKPQVTPGQLREVRGGDIMLRGCGMALLARAFLHCLENHVPFEEMGTKLAAVDWHTLDCPRETLTKGPTFGQEVFQHAPSRWHSLIVLREEGFRVSTVKTSVNTAWERLLSEIYPTPAVPVAAAA